MNAIIAICCLLPLFGAPQEISERSVSITRAEIAAHIRFLSHDLLEGRGIGTRGGALAEEYMETMFRLFGLEPAWDGGYMQEVRLRRVSADRNAKLTFSRNGTSLDFAFGGDFVALAPVPTDSDTFSAELVYVGRGIVAEAWNWDDYKDVDVRGKIVVMFVNEPGVDNNDLFEGRALTWYGRWMYKFIQAAQKGALGALLIHSREDAGYDWTVVYNGWSGNNFYSPDAPDMIPLRGWIAGPTAAKLFQLAGQDLTALRAAADSRDFRPVPLGVTATVRVKNAYEEIVTRNVAAIAKGRGGADAPAIVVSAHHDHLGIGNVEDGDNIYNGALDNCSASATMLALARHYGAHQGELDCDVIFLSCAAEEEGFGGSGYFVRYPPVPLTRMVANINLEMTNIWEETSDLVAIGARHSQLDDLITALAARHNLTVSPEAAPEQGYFFRSDQFSFALAGIPAVWFDAGDTPVGGEPHAGAHHMQDYRANRYHRPADEFSEDWPLQATVQVARLAVELIGDIDKRGMALDWKPGAAFKRP